MQQRGSNLRSFLRAALLIALIAMVATVTPGTASAQGADADADGVANLVDNCPTDSNPGQADIDRDGIGNACDPSTDLYTLKQGVVSDLEAAFADASGADAMRIGRALDHLASALDPELWDDPATLDRKDGAVVFTHEARAVRPLSQIDDGPVAGVAAKAVRQLTEGDRRMAAETVRAARAASGEFTDLADARAAIQAGNTARTNGDSVAAIQYYRKAWRLAENSLPAGERLVNLQVLAFNDYHGHVESGGAGTVGGVQAGGGEYLSAKLSELRSDMSNSLTVAAGDLVGGSPAFSGLFRDEPSIESLNAMGLDVSGVGNHEFDEGIDELLRLQNGGCHPVDGCFFPSEPYGGADFKWLAANTVNTMTGKTPLPPFSIHMVDGVPVAFIGMTLEATPTLVSASGIVGYEFRDEAETANKLVPVLKRRGVEAIIVLLHEGGSQNPAPGGIDACVGVSGPIVAINDALDPEIDAIVTGHTHLPYNCSLNDSAGHPRLVTSAYSYGRVVSEFDFVLDARTGDVRRDLSSATNHLVDHDSLAPDPLITAVIDKWQPLFDEAGNTPIGTITADITRGGDPTGSDRGVESAAGNLVADAQAWATSFNGADMAFMNPGGVRSDLTFASSDGEGDGVVTFGEAFTFQPFGNTLVTIPMTGDQIVALLEEQCQPAGSSRPILHLGVSNGVTYDLSTTVSAAGDCTAVSVTNLQLDGVAVDPAATYGVTVNSFLADGGDNFATLATIDPALRLDGGNDLEALSNYLSTFGPVDPPSTDRVNETP